MSGGAIAILIIIILLLAAGVGAYFYLKGITPAGTPTVDAKTITFVVH